MEKNFGERIDSDSVGTAAATIDVSAETSENSEPEPIATRRADALADVAETYMNSEPVPNATADRYQVVVHVVGAAFWSGRPYVAEHRDVRERPAANP